MTFTRQINRPVSKLSHADMHIYCAHIQTLTALFMLLCVRGTTCMYRQKHMKGRNVKLVETAFRVGSHYTELVKCFYLTRKHNLHPGLVVQLCFYTIIVVPSNH